MSAWTKWVVGVAVLALAGLGSVVEAAPRPPARKKAPDPKEAPEWALYRGDAARAAHAKGGAPVVKPAWTCKLVDHKQMFAWIDKAAGANKDRALPGSVPLVVGDKVIFRSYEGGYAAHHLKTGRVAWATRPEGAMYVGDLGRDSPVWNAYKDWFDAAPGGKPALQAVFDNSAVGTLSSDGENIYAVEDLSVPLKATKVGLKGADLELQKRAAFNMLQRWALKSGKLLEHWGGLTRGGLERHFFLAPALPLGDSAYLLARTDDKTAAVHLYRLRKGKEPWDEMKFAGKVTVAEKLRTVKEHPLLRTQAAHLAAGDGVLVCPTNDGVIAGVDQGTLKRLWSYTYRDAKTPPTAPGTGWVVTAPLVHDGKVVFTPPDADWVFCLRLKDGQLVWKAKRGEGLYLAGVGGGSVLLVGRSTCKALDLGGGGREWELKAGNPSGQGAFAGGRYYLPLREEAKSGQAGVAVLDVSAGKVVRFIPWEKGEGPGNLVFVGDMMLSLGLYKLTAHPLEKAGKE